MLSVHEALRIVMQHTTKGATETVSLLRALRRTLAEDLAATQDSPPFDKALMDGFAVAAMTAIPANSTDDTRTVTLSVVETITAGQLPQQTVNEDSASRIMTGALLPRGCNCVVPIELAQFDEQHPETVTIAARVMSAESNLIRQGTAAKAGTRLLAAGTILQPQHIAAMAEFGTGVVAVTRIPSVGVLATGDELIHYDQPLSPGRIRNSNEPMLLAQVAACHANPVALGIARDQEYELSERIQQGLQQDILLLTGGVSVGLLDLVPRQLAEAGVQQLFHGVNMKPGKPLWFGKREFDGRSCLVFGLPGNPVSSLTCFELFVRPALHQLSGCSIPEREMTAVLTEAITVRGSRPTWQPARLAIVRGQLEATPVPWSGSSDLRATVEANGMALLLPEHGPYVAGENVAAWLWGDGRIG